MRNLIVMVLMAFASPALAEDNLRPVLLGSNGNIAFQEPEEFTPTGLLASPEAVRYPRAIKQLIADEDLRSVPVETKERRRMIGFFTWEVVGETTKVLALEDDVLVVRSPTGAERQVTREKKRNPFGLLATMFFGCSVLGNMLAGRARSFVTFAAVVFAFAASATVVSAAVVFAFAASATVASAAVASAAVAFAFVASATGERGYRILSVVSMTAMAISVVMVVIGV